MIKKLHVLAVALLFSIPLLQAQTDPGLSAVATPSYCTDNGTIRITYTGTTVPDNYAIAPDPYDPATVITSATTNFTGVAPGSYQYGYTTAGNFVRGPATVTVTNVADSPPVFDRGATSEICGDPSPLVQSYRAVDPYGRTITYTMNPSGNGIGSINSTTGAIVWATYGGASGNYWFPGGEVTVTATVMGCHGPISATHIVNKKRKADNIYLKGRGPSEPTPIRSVCQGTVTSMIYGVTARRGGAIVFSISPSEAGTIATLPFEDFPPYGLESPGEITWNPDYTGLATVTGTVYGCEGINKSKSTIITVRPNVTAVTFELGDTSSICNDSQEYYKAVTDSGMPVTYTLTPNTKGQIVSVSPTNGALVRWYPGFTGDAIITATATGCSGIPVTATHTVALKPRPAAPGGDYRQAFCESAAPTVGDLVAVGHQVQWYDVYGGETPLDLTTPLINNKNYYASQFDPVMGCEGKTQRLTVLATVLKAPPTPTAPSPQELCGGVVPPTIANLVATGTNIRWYTTATGGDALLPSDPLSSGTYYVESNSTAYGVECPSDVRLSVQVIIKAMATPDMITVTGGSFCYTDMGGVVNGTATFEATAPTVTNPEFTWYSNPGLTAVVGTGPLYTTPILTTNRTYYVTVKGDDFCKNTIGKEAKAIRMPNAVASDIDADDVWVCYGQQGTFQASSNTVTNPVFRWYRYTGVGHVLLHTGDSFTPIEVPTSTVNFRFFVTVSGDNKCENLYGPNLKAVYLKGKPYAKPTHINVAPKTICPGQTATLTASSGTVIGGAVFKWYSDEALGAENELHEGAVFEPSPTITTTYYVTVQSPVVCENPSGQAKPVTVTVEQETREEDRTVVLCGASVLVTAQAGYDSYVWTDDSTGGVIGNDPEITLVAEGNYTVVATSPCEVLTEKITVISFLGQTTHPIAIFGDETAICPNDLTEMVKIALCGAGDSRAITISITDADSISWEQLDEGSCTTSLPDNCANIGPGCSWTERATGNVFSADTAGQWRVILRYQNGCSQTFYFNVYKNILDPQVQVQHKICSTNGSILVTNVPATGYEFSLNAAGPFTADPFFDNLLPGLHTLYIRATGFAGNPNQCTFKVQDIEVKELIPAMAVTLVQPVCNAGLGSIQVIMTEGAPQYRYRLFQSTNLIADSGLLSGPGDHEYTFTGVNPGLYTVKTTLDAGCERNEDVEITNPDPIVVVANVTREITCEPGEITLSLTGGTAPFTYEFDGAVVPDALFPVTTPGTYTVVVTDAMDCKGTTDVTVGPPVAPEFTVAGSAVACYNAAAGTIIFTVTNDYGFTLEYSIDNGTTYQDSGLFNNLVPNTYQVLIRYVVYTLSNPGGVTNIYCQSPVQTVVVSGPYQPLQASVGVAKDISCDPVNNKAEVHITNAEGGAVPYTYSFDGVTYGPSNIGFLGVGTFTVYIRDAGGCNYPMEVTIEPEPAAPEFTSTIAYHCDGTAEVTLHNDSTDYTYEYSIDGTPRQTGNIFPGILPGYHEIITYYTAIRPPNNSILLHEDFGAGPNTSIPNIDPVYCYESQTLAKTCGPNIELQDGEYCVTQGLNPNNVSWVATMDHTGNPNGRFLALNVGGVAGLQGVIYEKQIRDIYPNQDLITSMYAMNLLRSPTSSSPPNILVQLVDNTGAVVASQDTGNIPSNNIWNQYEIRLNPGPNSELKLVIRTNSIVTEGNDLALDDIEVYQIPEICEREHPTTLNIEDKKFEAELISVTDVSCKGAADGKVAIQVKNQGNLETGDPYYGISTDGGVTWYSAEDEVFTLNENFGPGTHEIRVQNSYPSGTCIVPLTFTITEPETLEITKVVTAKTCLIGGSVVINTTGGTLPYAYELTDPDGDVFAGSSTGVSCLFDGLLIPGIYEIKVTDNGTCDVIETFEIKDPEALTVTVSTASNLCSDASGATIEVAVAGGVAPYRYALSGQAPQDSAVFAGLVPGNYTIIVIDAYGCVGTVTQTIGRELVALAVLAKNLDCGPTPEAVIGYRVFDGGIGPFRYQVAIDGNPYGPEISMGVVNGDLYYTATPGTYKFKITDALNCAAETTIITVDPIVLPEITAVTVTDVIKCNGRNALIRVDINTAKGLAPFVITVADGAGTDYPDYLSGLPAGTYTVTLTDAKGCSDTETITITEPDPIDFTIGITPITCTGTGTEFGIIHIQGVTGGTGPYVYKLFNSLGDELNVEGPTMATDHDFTVVDFGFYTVLVIDANDCPKEIKDIAVASPPESLDIEFDLTTSDCVSGATAKVTVGGTILGGPFEFAIVENPAQRHPTGFVVPNSADGLSHTFTGLIPGATYSFAVYDHTSACHYFRQADVPSPSDSTLKPVMHPENVSCRGAADGKISFEFSDYHPSTTSVSYQLYHALTNLPNGMVGTSSGLTPGQTVTVTDFRNDLTPGEYYIVFTQLGGDPDVDGCRLASPVFTIEESAVALSVTAYLTKNANCKSDSGQITAVSAGGTAPYEYQLVPDGSPAPTIATWAGTAANVLAANGGDYIVYSKDANNCIQASAVVTVPVDPTPDITAVLVDACATNGNFTIRVTRGADGIAPYRYSLDGGVFQTQPDTFDYNNLSAGTHTIIIKDVNDCGIPVIVDIHPPLVPGAPVVTHPMCANTDGTITMNPAGGSGNLEYKLEDGAGTELVPFGPSNTFTGLAGGSYTVIIRDTVTKCEVTAAVILEVPIGVTFTTTATATSCFGAANGTITVVLEPGNTDVPYTYSKDGLNWQNSPVFTGLTAGNYNITVKSAKDCELTVSSTVTEPTLITIPVAAVSATEFGCTTGNTFNNAVITIDPALITGGSGTYISYKFVDDATGVILQNGSSPVLYYTNTNGGTVTIYVYDTKGCEGTTTATVQPYVPLVAGSITLNSRITCLAGEEVLITVTGGSGNFSYQLLPSGTPQVSPTFVLPAVGTYYFRITDTVTNCFITEEYKVLPFDFINVMATATAPVSCFGASDGALEINVSGYTGDYNYTVLDSAGNPIATGAGNTAVNPLGITGLPGGNVTVIVEAVDSPFCTEVSNGVTIGTPGSALQLTLTERGSVTCTNNQGEIWAQATGGWGIYMYQLVNDTTGATITDYSSSGLFSHLSAGSYLVNVKDAKGCIVPEKIVLALPVPIVVTASADRTAVACFGDKTATITASATGGQGTNYVYTLLHHESGLPIGPQFSPVFANLGAGTYTISVKDNWACTADALPITITQPDVVVGILAQTTGLTCTTGALLTITASGGTAPYEYSADGVNFGPGNTFTVPVGIYQYYVRDFNGCSKLTNTITILPVPELTIALDLTGAVVNCSGDAGAVIQATANGGLGNYSYELLDGTTSTVIAGPQPDGLFTGIGSGNYRIRVTSLDCKEDSDLITITEPVPLNIVPTVQNVLCNGMATGSISIAVTGGTGTIMYAISPNLEYWATNPVFSNLGAGVYTIAVQDANGCYDSLELTITEPAALDANLVIVSEELCFGSGSGIIRVEPSGGVGPYATSINSNLPGDFVVGKVIYDNLAGGQTYTIYIRDNNGCEIARMITLADPVVLSANYELNYSCFNNTPDNELVITVNAEATGHVMYALDTGSYQTGNTFTNIPYGNHIFKVKHTNGCIFTEVFTVEHRVKVVAVPVVEHVVCGAEPTGKITMNVSAGTGPYVYSISPNNDDYGASNVFDNLLSGSYLVHVKDSNGCILIQTVIVTGPPALVVTLANLIPELCYGDGDASFTIAITGGVGPHATSLNNGPFIPGKVTYDDLVGGQTYHIQVRDANGCITPLDVPVANGVEIEPVADVTYGCINNTPSNTVTITVNPDVVSDVVYSLNGVSQLENVFTNLAPGTHTVEVTHSTGCTQPVTFTIAMIQPLTVTAVEEGLNQIKATAQGGQPGYRYYFNDHDNGTNPLYQFSHSGTYTVKVVDANGCEALTLIAVVFIDIEVPNFFTPNDDGENDTWTPLNIQHYPKISTDIHDRSGRKVATIRQWETWDGVYNGTPLPSGDYWYVISLNNGTNREIVGHVTIYR